MVKRLQRGSNGGVDAGRGCPVAAPNLMSAPIPVPNAPPAHDAGLLARITADLAGGGDPTALLPRFLGPVVAVCGAEAGAMRVLSPDGQGFELVADLGLPDEVRRMEQRVSSGCGVCGAVAGSLEVAWSDHRAPCGREVHHPFFMATGRRVLAVPLAHRGRVLGVCNLFFTGGVELPDQVIALLKTLGEVIGLALHGARLESEALRATVMAERQLMAAEVHDSIAQTLVFAKMRMPLLEAAVADGDRAAAQRYIGDVRRAVGQAHGGLRDVLGHLREPVDAPDLHHAVDSGRRRLMEQAAVDLEVHDAVPDLALSAPQAHQVQRIVQEALNNVARHAGARHAWLHIERHGDQLEIRVDDDGRGLPDVPPGAGEQHYGLDIMRQRAALLGGGLEVEPRPQGGTCVRLHFPVEAVR